MRAKRPYTNRQWDFTRRAVLDKANWTCRTCGRTGRSMEVDHVRPIHRGGAALDMANLQSLCKRCHLEKSRTEASIRYPRDWGKRRAADRLVNELITA